MTIFLQKTLIFTAKIRITINFMIVLLDMADNLYFNSQNISLMIANRKVGLWVPADLLVSDFGVNFL